MAIVSSPYELSGLEIEIGIFSMNVIPFVSKPDIGVHFAHLKYMYE